MPYSNIPPHDLLSRLGVISLKQPNFDIVNFRSKIAPAVKSFPKKYRFRKMYCFVLIFHPKNIQTNQSMIPTLDFAPYTVILRVWTLEGDGKI